MSRRSLLALGGFVAALIFASVLMDREDMRAATVDALIVDMSGDTVPVGIVPAEIASLLEEGRSWRAARALRSHLEEEDASDEVKLLAARTEAQSGSWRRAREALEGQPWLDDVWNGEGWFWLARAHEEAGDDERALESYDRFLALRGTDSVDARRAVAELRRGLTLLRLERRDAGAAALQAIRDRVPALEEWVTLLSAEALVESGDTAATASAAGSLPGGTVLRHRARLADIAAREGAGHPRSAIDAAIAYRQAGASASETAALAKEAGRIALEVDDLATARRELTLAIETGPGTAAARDAANLLATLPDLSAAEWLTIAGIYERHGNARRAAEGFRNWLAEAPASDPERPRVNLRLGRALFNAGDFAAAERILRPLQDAPPAIAREALHLTGRSEYRRGARTASFATFETLASRFPGSVEGSEALYLVGDLSHDDMELQTAARVYRRVADHFPGTDRAGLSLMRLAGIHFEAGDFLEAARVWEEYRSSYPGGERWLQSTYWAARAHEEMGDRARAETLYRAIAPRDPLSYYSLLAAERLGEPYWPIPMGPAPPVDATAETRVDQWMVTVDMLREAGLHGEADTEAQRLAESAPAELPILYSLAEALNERGYAIRGIRIGQRIEEMSDGMNPRLLRVLYPFPYRALIEAEAREAGLDPFLVAGLTRQESLFTRRISSPVGARGLMQIMPETGAALARGARIEEWDPELLFNPEINVHLGITYLAAQMREYDESLPSVFSAYNAGPVRIDAWKAFPEYDDEELFTERIPYRETRDYVKILTRNIAIYRGLYGEEVSGARAAGATTP